MTTENDAGITVSGVAYYGACDPRTSNVPKEEGWPEPKGRKVGRGRQFVYPAWVSGQVASHLEEVGSSLANYGGSPEDRAEGRAMLRDARRYRTQHTTQEDK